MEDATTIAALEQRVAELEALVARLAAERPGGAADPPLAAPTPVVSAVESTTSTERAPGLDRRRLLTRGGTAAVGAVLGGAAATIATATPAAAATGTFDTTDATPALTATTSGTGVAAHVSSSTSAAALHSDGLVEIFATGLHRGLTVGGGVGESPGIGIQISAAGIGLLAAGSTWGVHGASDGENSSGVFGHGGTGYGLLATGARANLLLKAPGFPYPAMPDPTTSGIAHQAGELYWSDDAVLWVCIAEGTPGTWRRATGADTTGALTMLASPVRVYDSRVGYPPSVGPKTPLAPGVDRVIDCTANTSGLPTDATAAIVTITIANPTGPGWLAARANEAPYTGTSTINWTGQGAVIATTTTTALGPAATIALRTMTTTDVVVDVIGYHR